jgi:CspA family cold shock protein
MDRTERRRLGLPIEQPKRQIETKVSGVVKFYDSKKGFGFITASNGVDVHVSQSNLQNASVLTKGDRVEFFMRDGNKGKWAANVNRL